MSETEENSQTITDNNEADDNTNTGVDDANQDDQNTDDQNTDDQDDGEGEKDDENSEINPDDYTPQSRGGDSDDSKDDDGKDDDDDLDPDDKAKIDRQINKKLSPLEKKIREQEDQIDVNNFVLENPEMGKYKPVILKYMKHDAYRNIPVADIAKIVAASDMKKIGAKLEREAQKKVKGSKNAGSSTRNNSSTKFNAETATFAEMEAEIARVKGQI